MDLPLTPSVDPYRADRAHSWCPQSIRRLAAMQANFSSTLYTHSSWTARCWRLTRFQENEYTYIKPATLLNNQVGAVSKEHTWAYQPVWLVLGQEYPWNSGRGRQRFMNHGDRHTLQCTGHAFMFTRLTSSTKSVCSSPCRDLDTRTSLRLPLVISRPKLAELLNTVMKLSGYWDIYTCTAYSRPSASILTIFSPSDVPTSTYKLISLFLVLVLIILVYFSKLFINYIYGFSEHFSDHRFRVIFPAYKMSQFVGFSWTTPLNFIKSFWEESPRSKYINDLVERIESETGSGTTVLLQETHELYPEQLMSFLSWRTMSTNLPLYSIQSIKQNSTWTECFAFKTRTAQKMWFPFLLTCSAVEYYKWSFRTW